MNIVFMGTPEFSVPSLRELVKHFNVTAVFTQPDRPKGRGKKILYSPVKECALEYNIPVYQPVKLKKEQEFIEKLKELKPDFIIVVAYGQILPKEVLDIPKYGCINLHASLLPKYRGAAPINYAIINGEKTTGNTTMFMEEGLDTGDILLKNEVVITEDMNYGELHDKLMESGKDLLVQTINGVANGTIKRVQQQDELSTYASMLNKEMGRIDWNNCPEDIHNLIRGLNPKPAAYTNYEDKTMKIYKASVKNEQTNEEPGKILKVSKEGVEVATGKNGVLILNIIQFPGGKALEVGEFIKGNSLNTGEFLK